MKENINKIIDKACALWGVGRQDVLGKSRNMPLPFARSMVAKTLRDAYGLSYPKIGKILNRNHSTIFKYFKMYDAEYKYNQVFRNFADIMKEVVLDVRTSFEETLEEELKGIIG